MTGPSHLDWCGDGDCGDPAHSRADYERRIQESATGLRLYLDAEVAVLRAQRDEAVRALRKMADGLGIDWVDHPVLSQEWADAIPTTGEATDG